MGAAKAFEAITVGDTAVGFTAAQVAVYSSANVKPPSKVVCTVDTAQIMIRWDPSASNMTSVANLGNLINIGDVFEIEGLTDLQNFRAVKTGATAGMIRATYEKEY